MRPHPQRSSFSIMLSQMYYYIISSQKKRVEVANSGKTMTFYERSELFRKYLKTTVFDHSNYRLFERIPAVPGTSNNRGLTVVILIRKDLSPRFFPRMLNIPLYCSPF